MTAMPYSLLPLAVRTILLNLIDVTAHLNAYTPALLDF
jgi:hypothetical protein